MRRRTTLAADQPDQPNQLDPRWLDENGLPIDEEDRGLVYDLQTLVNRRRVLGLFGGLGAAGLLAACGSSSDSSAASTTSSSPATAGYEQSVSNLAQTSLSTDNVFGDDSGIHQLATMSGDTTSGYTAALTIGV